jgi:hypothetical protein
LSVLILSLFADAQPLQSAIPVSNIWGLIGVLLPSILALLAALTSWSNRINIAKAAVKAEELHIAVNSRLTQLLEATVAASRAMGVEAERDKSEVTASQVASQVAALVAAQFAAQAATAAATQAAALAAIQAATQAASQASTALAAEIRAAVDARTAAAALHGKAPDHDAPTTAAPALAPDTRVNG